jgi:hypothetical protein
MDEQKVLKQSGKSLCVQGDRFKTRSRLDVMQSFEYFKLNMQQLQEH